MNNASLNRTDKEWTVTKSNKDKPKLCSLGYYYIVEKPTKSINYEGLRITWKCENIGCRGRGHSNGLEPPFQLSRKHNHLPDPVRCKVLKIGRENEN